MADPATETHFSDRKMTLLLLAENTDLKHQISALCARMAAFRASMTVQLGCLSSQVIQLSQLAKSRSRKCPGCHQDALLYGHPPDVHCPGCRTTAPTSCQT